MNFQAGKTSNKNLQNFVNDHAKNYNNKKQVNFELSENGDIINSVYQAEPE